MEGKKDSMDGEGFNFFHFKLMWCARCIFHASVSKANRTVRTEHNCKCPYALWCFEEIPVRLHARKEIVKD